MCVREELAFACNIWKGLKNERGERGTVGRERERENIVMCYAAFVGVCQAFWSLTNRLPYSGDFLLFFNCPFS